LEWVAFLEVEADLFVDFFGGFHGEVEFAVEDDGGAVFFDFAFADGESVLEGHPVVPEHFDGLGAHEAGEGVVSVAVGFVSGDDTDLGGYDPGCVFVDLDVKRFEL
jgi:hypothetical protein